MNPGTLRILFVLFLAAHGYIHMSLAQVPVPQPGALHTPFLPSWWRADVDSSWPVARLGLSPAATRTLGWALWLLTTAGFVLAAAALLFFPALPALWQGITLVSSVLSLALLALYWHPWYPFGVLISLALLAGVLMKWPLLQFGR